MMEISSTLTEGIPMLLGAAAISIAICASAKSLGTILDVMAIPDGAKRKHSCSTPQVGGLAILIPLILWCCLNASVKNDETNILKTVLLAAAGVGLVGFADDQRETSPLSRMLSLVVFLAMSFSLDPELISRSLHWGSFANVSISPYLYGLLMAVTFVGLVNAVNMADGQNGIVGSIYIIWLTCLFLKTSGITQDIAAVLLACSLVFLSFNLRGHIFLGDAGTYGVTFVIGLLVTLAHARSELTLETITVWFYIPVLDCLRLFITRPMNNRSPLDGDRDHFHHRLEDKFGKNAGLAIYASLVAITSLTSTLAPRFSLVCLIILTAVYFSFARLTGSIVVDLADVNEDAHQSSTVVLIDEKKSKKNLSGAGILSG
jgi:UDP-GlcNAc:undecaprenyl-phosphate GlcNAc-1-phosphate transferase